MDFEFAARYMLSRQIREKSTNSKFGRVVGGISRVLLGGLLSLDLSARRTCWKHQLKPKPSSSHFSFIQKPQNRQQRLAEPN